MGMASKKRILKLIETGIRPLVRLLIRNNIDVRLLHETIKRAYVSVALEDFGIRERRTNISRVSLITGVTRKEASRIRKDLDSGKQSVKKAVPLIERVLDTWHSDKAYLTTGGKPRALTFNAGEVNFSTLVTQCKGDVPPGAVRAELLRLKAIEQRTNDSLLPVVRHLPVYNLDGVVNQELGDLVGKVIDSLAQSHVPEIAEMRYKGRIESRSFDAEVSNQLCLESEQVLRATETKINNVFQSLAPSKTLDQGGKRIGIVMLQYEMGETDRSE